MNTAKMLAIRAAGKSKKGRGERIFACHLPEDA
jgi:hypothetical protein